MYVRTYVSMYIRVCMYYVRVYVLMYVCIYVFMCPWGSVLSDTDLEEYECIGTRLIYFAQAQEPVCARACLCVCVERGKVCVLRVKAVTV